jgi:hypothetical protein
MGSFLTNLQVRSDALDALVAALRADAGARGMDELAPDAASVDRHVVVLPPLNGWITIYDEATESQDTDALDALARLATKATSALGFTALVHDSDVLDLRLYRDGAPVDHKNTDPGYFERVSKKKAAALAGHPDAWADLADPAKVADVFRAENLFAEGTLASVAELVGVDRGRASVGYRYFASDVIPAPEGAVTLRFRSRVRPSWEESSAGPPGLEVQSHMGDRVLRLAVPDELRLGLTARSTGAASTGLEVRAWGSALERGAVAIDRFELVLGDALSKKDRRVVQLEAERTASADGTPMWFAKRADLALPAGSQQPPAFQPGVDVAKMMEAMRRASVHVNVIGRCIAPGAGEIGVALVPLASPKRSAATIAKVEISAPIARPLRFDERLASQPGGSSHLLAPLVGDRWHVALLASDRPRSELTELARGMIEDARDVLGAGDAQTTIYRATPGAKPGSGRGKSSAMLSGKRFESFLASMRTEQLVSVVVTDGGEIDYVAAQRDGGHGRFGVSLGTGVLPHYEDERVPTIMAWLDARRPEAAAVADRWAARFDAEMRDGRGLQATLTRGAWQPQCDMTAYENACGFAHGVRTLREWVSRWLRVPGTDRTWLSAPLAAHLTDRAALDAIADVASVGDALRITLRDRAHLGDLERALAALLPTAAESHEVQRAFFARHATR